jgi:hypothetical protein
MRQYASDGKPGPRGNCFNFDPVTLITESDNIITVIGKSWSEIPRNDCGEFMLEDDTKTVA